MTNSTQKIYLNFQGYWRERGKGAMPASAGLYCVYRARFSPTEETLVAHQLLYIGESRNIRAALTDAHRLREWRGHLQPGEELCFSFAPAVLDRQRAAIAMIHQHEPVANRHRDPAPDADVTEILLSGRIQLLNFSFRAFDHREIAYEAIRPTHSRSREKIFLRNWQNWVDLDWRDA